MRPSSMARNRCRRFARPPDVLAMLAKMSAISTSDSWPHEKAEAAKTDRFLKRVFRDLAENDAMMKGARGQSWRLNI